MTQRDDTGVASPSAALTAGDKQRRLAFWALMLLSIAVLSFSWTRTLDNLTLGHLDEAMLGTGAIYATARSINALVSVLQGTEIDVVFVSFTVGEMLDPINDLIERFSGLLLIALGSLALQQLLVLIASHPLANLALTGIAALTLLGWFRGGPHLRVLLVRILLFTFALRLVLPIIVLTTNWVDRTFLLAADEERIAQVQQFQGQLEKVGKQVGINAQESEEAGQLRSTLTDIDASRLDAEARIAVLEDDLNKARSRLADLPRPPLWKPWESDTPEVLALRGEIDVIEGQLGLRRDVAQQLGEEAAAIRDRLECLQRRSEGRECTFAEGAANLVRKVDLRPQLLAISERVDAFAADLIGLLISLLFKSVLLPLATLWVTLKLVSLGARALTRV